MLTNRHQQGFSLIELLIVVAIIGIIAAIAIPNLIASRIAANEAATIQSVRLISGAQATYHVTGGNGQYGTLAQLKVSALLDPLLADATTSATSRSGYMFAVTNPDADDYTTGAAPRDGRTGTRNFSSNASGVIYNSAATPGVAPTATSGTPISN